MAPPVIVSLGVLGRLPPLLRWYFSWLSIVMMRMSDHVVALGVDVTWRGVVADVRGLATGVGVGVTAAGFGWSHDVM